MTKEEKQLLIKDLCARLPYGVIVETKENGYNWSGELKFFGNGKFGYDINRPYEIERIKPYLRPMSSMTEDEDKEWQLYKGRIAESCDELLEKRIAELHDWFNRHQFDFRGLIPMGIAIEAKKGMYKTE